MTRQTFPICKMTDLGNLALIYIYAKTVCSWQQIAEIAFWVILTKHNMDELHSWLTQSQSKQQPINPSQFCIDCCSGWLCIFMSTKIGLVMMITHQAWYVIIPDESQFHHKQIQTFKLWGPREVKVKPVEMSE